MLSRLAPLVLLGCFLLFDVSLQAPRRISSTEECPVKCMCILGDDGMMDVDCLTDDETKALEKPLPHEDLSVTDVVEMIDPVANRADTAREELSPDEPQAQNASVEEIKPVELKQANNTDNEPRMVIESATFLDVKEDKETNEPEENEVDDSAENESIMQADEPIDDDNEPETDEEVNTGEREVPEELIGDPDAKVVAKKGPNLHPKGDDELQADQPAAEDDYVDSYDEDQEEEKKPEEVKEQSEKPDTAEEQVEQANPPTQSLDVPEESQKEAELEVPPVDEEQTEKIKSEESVAEGPVASETKDEMSPEPTKDEENVSEDENNAAETKDDEGAAVEEPELEFQTKEDATEDENQTAEDTKVNESSAVAEAKDDEGENPIEAPADDEEKEVPVAAPSQDEESEVPVAAPSQDEESEVPVAAPSQDEESASPVAKKSQEVENSSEESKEEKTDAAVPSEDEETASEAENQAVERTDDENVAPAAVPSEDEEEAKSSEESKDEDAPGGDDDPSALVLPDKTFPVAQPDEEAQNANETLDGDDGQNKNETILTRMRQVEEGEREGSDSIDNVILPDGEILVVSETIDDALSGKIISEGESETLTTDPQQSTASWVILGLILGTFICVLGYAAIRGGMKKKEEADITADSKLPNSIPSVFDNKLTRKPEFEGTELKELSRHLLQPLEEPVNEYKDKKDDDLKQVVVPDSVSSFPYIDAPVNFVSKPPRANVPPPLELPAPNDTSRNDTSSQAEPSSLVSSPIPTSPSLVVTRMLDNSPQVARVMHNGNVIDDE
jgi:hypothetical protein